MSTSPTDLEKDEEVRNAVWCSLAFDKKPSGEVISNRLGAWSLGDNGHHVVYMYVADPWHTPTLPHLPLSMGSPLCTALLLITRGYMACSPGQMVLDMVVMVVTFLL